MVPVQLASIEGQFVAIVVGLVIGAALLGIGNRRNRRNQPTGRDRANLLSDIAQMRRNGAGFHECVTFLQERGLRQKVAEGLIIDADSELIEDDIAHPQSVSKSWCSFQAPGNWRVAKINPALDDDAYFSVEAAGGAITTFSNFESDARDLREILDESIKDLQSEHASAAIVESLTRWGNVEGLGQRVTGTPKSHPIEMQYTVFVFRHAGGVAAISQGCIDESADRHRPALSMIAESFAPHSNG